MDKKVMTVETKPELSLRFETELIPTLIKGGPDEETTITLEADFEKELPGFELSSLVNVSYHKDQNLLSVSTNDDLLENSHGLGSLFSRLFSRSGNLNALRLTIQVPASCSVKAQSENAPLYVAGINGNINAETENSSLKLEESTGQATLQTENGGINVKQFEGPLQAETENGGITLNGVKGDINAETENGGIRLSNCGGQKLTMATENGALKVVPGSYSRVKVQSENGSIYYEFDNCEEGDFVFENENGKITLVIPDETPLNFCAENEQGSIHIGISGNYQTIGSEDERRVELIKGTGKVKVRAINENGSIVVLKDPMQTITSKIKIDTDSFGGINLDIEQIGQEVQNALAGIPEKISRFKIGSKIATAMQQIPKNLHRDVNNIVNTVMAEVETALGKDEQKARCEAKAASDLHEQMQDYKEELREYQAELVEYQQDMQEYKTELEQIKAKQQNGELGSDAVLPTPPVPPMPPVPFTERSAKAPRHPKGDKSKELQKKLRHTIKKVVHQFKQEQGQDEQPVNNKSAQDENRAKILQLLSDGKITVQDAEKLLKALPLP